MLDLMAYPPDNNLCGDDTDKIFHDDKNSYHGDV
jgi:hypothetical protein